MASLHTLKTQMLVSIGGGDEREVEAHVSYWYTPAWPQSSQDPGSDASIEIDNIQLKNGGEYHTLPYWLIDAFDFDDALIAACMSDIADAHAAAAEYAAEARRDDAMMERF